MMPVTSLVLSMFTGKTSVFRYRLHTLIIAATAVSVLTAVVRIYLDERTEQKRQLEASIFLSELTRLKSQGWAYEMQDGEIVGASIGFPRLGNKQIDLRKDLECFSKLPNLKRLLVVCFRDVDSQLDNIGSLECLGKLRHLQSIELDGRWVDDSIAETALQVESITDLTFLHTSITDAALLKLSQLEHLSSLNVAGCNIGDPGVLALIRYNSIEHLNLSKTLISNVSIDSLGELSGLKTLDVTGTRLTELKITHLRELLPLCVITSE